MNEVTNTFKESLEKINEVISSHQEILNTSMPGSSEYQESLKGLISQLGLKKILINNEISIN